MNSRQVTITPMQKLVYDAVNQIGEDGWPVTVREIMVLTGHASPATVHAHLRNLIDIGLISENPRGRSGFRANHWQVVL